GGGAGLAGVANGGGGDDDDELRALGDVGARLEEPAKHRDVGKERHARLAAIGPVADQAAQHHRLAVLHGHRGGEPALVDGGRVDAGGGGRHYVVHLLVDLERH